MRKWGKRSQRVYDTLSPQVQKIMDRVLQEVADITLISGYRDLEEQNDLFDAGKSHLRYPNSKHNVIPSIAVDFQPYPYPRADNKLWGALGYIAGHAIAIAREEGLSLRWGGDWNRDGDLTNQKFDDLFHLEIYNENIAGIDSSPNGYHSVRDE